MFALTNTNSKVTFNDLSNELRIYTFITVKKEEFKIIERELPNFQYLELDKDVSLITKPKGCHITMVRIVPDFLTAKQLADRIIKDKNELWHIKDTILGHC